VKGGSTKKKGTAFLAMPFMGIKDFVSPFEGS
jgi:hypothetical protein